MWRRKCGIGRGGVGAITGLLVGGGKKSSTEFEQILSGRVAGRMRPTSPKVRRDANPDASGRQEGKDSEPGPGIGNGKKNKISSEQHVKERA